MASGAFKGGLAEDTSVASGVRRARLTKVSAMGSLR